MRISPLLATGVVLGALACSEPTTSPNEPKGQFAQQGPCPDGFQPVPVFVVANGARVPRPRMTRSTRCCSRYLRGRFRFGERQPMARILPLHQPSLQEHVPRLRERSWPGIKSGSLRLGADFSPSPTIPQVGKA